MNSDKQEQEGASLTTLHSALGPHGEGSHGFCGTAGSGAKRELSLWFLKVSLVTGILKPEILRRGTHWTNGSPVSSGGQPHMGLWLTTLQVALNPHVPEHGLTHFWLLQACVRGQSELTVHSGLQVGGAPKNPATQEQTGWPLISRQTLLGPQGEGEHGLPFTVSVIMIIW